MKQYKYYIVSLKIRSVKNWSSIEAMQILHH